MYLWIKELGIFKLEMKLQRISELSPPKKYHQSYILLTHKYYLIYILSIKKKVAVLEVFQHFQASRRLTCSLHVTFQQVVQWARM